MTVKLYEVINLNQALKLIIDGNYKKIDAVLKFKLLGIMKSIAVHVENYEIIKSEKIREYGKETDDGKISIPLDDKEVLENFNNDMDKVTNCDVEVNISKFKAQDVFDKGIPADILMLLYPFIEE